MKKEATVYPIHKSQGRRHWNKIFLLNLGWYTFNHSTLGYDVDPSIPTESWEKLVLELLNFSLQ